METTLNKIRAKGPCASGWKKLLANLGKTEGDDEPLGITVILESNGLDDALWCLRAIKGHDKELRLFAVQCARSVQHLLTDKRSLAALDTAERFADGQATAQEMAAAGAAAREAAWAAAWAAAGAAAREAAWAAAGAAARAAAREAAREAQANLLILVCKGCLD